MKTITLSSQLERMKSDEVKFLIKEIMEHEEIKKSQKHMDALKIVKDILEEPSPRAWYMSSDSDVLRCPNCGLRVPGGNPWRDGEYVKPMNPFCRHADSIYELNTIYCCYGCNKYFEIIPKSGEAWTISFLNKKIREICLKESNYKKSSIDIANEDVKLDDNRQLEFDFYKK